MWMSPRVRVLSNLRHNIDSSSANWDKKCSVVLDCSYDSRDGCRDTQNKIFKRIKLRNDYWTYCEFLIIQHNDAPTPAGGSRGIKQSVARGSSLNRSPVCASFFFFFLMIISDKITALLFTEQALKRDDFTRLGGIESNGESPTCLSTDRLLKFTPLHSSLFYVEIQAQR